MVLFVIGFCFKVFVELSDVLWFFDVNEIYYFVFGDVKVEVEFIVWIYDLFFFMLVVNIRVRW